MAGPAQEGLGRGVAGGWRRGVRWLVRIVAAGVALVVLVVSVSALPLLVLRRGPVDSSAFMQRSLREDPATKQPCAEVEQAWVPRESISPHLRLAVVLAEDQKFLLHDGFDSKAIRKAIDEAERGVRRRGASTITQQLAKNLFLWPDASFVRKGLEAWITLWIELLWSKQRILEVYLNVVQFGPCVFGAEAAAQRYFDKPAAELLPEEAALLATVLPNPLRLRAWNPGPYARSRRDELVGLMDELGRARHLRGL
ncbi:MAG: monofunctional biosynthetic peptidoglycan transglycosylase [Deltaproteobacteria bacterium]|nr:monofunctional biosynthetic peptidoglycan transglycosylase [Deltaproteobacteria bacterium]